eukprot:2928063-Pyramimonas_sp.AAC.1
MQCPALFLLHLLRPREELAEVGGLAYRSLVVEHQRGAGRGPDVGDHDSRALPAENHLHPPVSIINTGSQ